MASELHCNMQISGSFTFPFNSKLPPASLRTLLEAPDPAVGHVGVGEPLSNKAKIFYHSCMDRDKIDALGDAPLKPYLQSIDWGASNDKYSFAFQFESLI